MFKCLKEGWWKFGQWQSFCVKNKIPAKIAIFSLKTTQLKIFLCLIQAPNTTIQICRNKGATKKASRKTVYDKVFKVLSKKITLIKNIVVPLKQSISHKSVHCYSLWKMLDGECLVHDKKKFLKWCPNQKIFFGLSKPYIYIQAHI